MDEKTKMTYRLDPVLERVASPIALVMPDGRRIEFPDGKTVAEATFDRRYAVERVVAVNDVVEIGLEELCGPVAGPGSWETFF